MSHDPVSSSSCSSSSRNSSGTSIRWRTTARFPNLNSSHLASAPCKSNAPHRSSSPLPFPPSQLFPVEHSTRSPAFHLRIPPSQSPLRPLLPVRLTPACLWSPIWLSVGSQPLLPIQSSVPSRTAITATAKPLPDLFQIVRLAVLSLLRRTTRQHEDFPTRPIAHRYILPHAVIHGHSPQVWAPLPFSCAIAPLSTHLPVQISLLATLCTCGRERTTCREIRCICLVLSLSSHAHLDQILAADRLNNRLLVSAPYCPRI